MSNEMKLIMALCDALGFEVETTIDYQPRKENKQSAMNWNSGRQGLERVLATTGTGNMLDIDDNDEYTSLLTSPVIDYKLTQKPTKGE